MNYPAASYGVSKSNNTSCCWCNFLYSFSRPCFLTYSIIVFSLPNWLTVFMKNPSVQNSPPHNTFLTDDNLRKISLAVILLIVLTIFVGLFIGTDWIRKWTWSLSTPISINEISCRLDISRHMSLNSLSTSSVNTTWRYFDGNTAWYKITDTLWLLCIYSLTYAIWDIALYEASFGELNPERLKNAEVCVFHTEQIPGTSRLGF